MAASVEPRLLQAQTDHLAPIDFLSALVGDELLRRQDRLLERRIKHAGFRDVGKTLDTVDFDFNNGAISRAQVGVYFSRARLYPSYRSHSLRLLSTHA